MVSGRINQIKAEIERLIHYDQKSQERLAKLFKKVAVLRVGVATEVELEEKTSHRRC